MTIKHMALSGALITTLLLTAARDFINVRSGPGVNYPPFTTIKQ